MKNKIKTGIFRKLHSRLHLRISPASSVAQERIQLEPPEAITTQVRAVVVNDSLESIAEISRYLFVHSQVDVAGVALNGYEALEAVGQLRPQLVIMDLQMPGMNGLDTTEQLRRMFPSICIIMTSADDGSEIASLCQDYGADAFVGKSRLQRDLLPAIRQAFSRHSVD
jgi:DNA-binding NarL/FixJ family response regulator